MFCHPANIAHTLVNTLTQQSRNIFLFAVDFLQEKLFLGRESLKRKHRRLIPLVVEDDFIY